MKKNYYSWIIWLFFYIFVFAFLLYNSFSYLDPDFGWHLQVGREIIQGGNVPDSDKYTYTLAGQNWVDHEWLFNVLVYWLYEKYGYVALTVFFALVMVFTLALLAYYFKKNHRGSENDAYLLMIVQFFGIKAMAPHLGVRMQEVAILFLLILLIILERYEQAKKSKILVWLVPLFFIWANLHGSFLIGLAVIALWFAVKLAAIFITKISGGTAGQNDRVNFRLISIYLFWGSAAFAATFINPYGAGLYEFLGSWSNTYYLTHITEWLPFYYLSIQHNQLFFCAIVVAIFCIQLITDTYKKNYRGLAKNLLDNLRTYSMIALFLYLALKSKRHFPLFFIASFSYVVKFFTDNFSLPENFSRTIKDSRLIKFYFIGSLCLLSAVFLLSAQYTHNPFTAKNYCRFYPCRAIDFIKSQPAYRDLKIFNSYSWGGFLIWTWPEKPLFIDGRIPQYDFAGRTILEEYHEFYKPDQARILLDKYGIELILVDQIRDYKFSWFEKYLLRLKKEDKEKINSSFLEYLDNASEWKKIYHDDISLIYVKI